MTDQRQHGAAAGDDSAAALARELIEKLRAPGGAQGIDPSMVTALAGDVRALGDRVNTLGVDVAQLGELSTNVQAMSEHVEQLKRSVDDLTATPPAALADWLTLDAEEAEERWREVTYWVENVLVAGYNVSRKQLPDCWAMHRPAMVHLSWLYATYRQAYDPRSNPTLAGEWSTRWLRDGLDALRGERVAPLARCKPVRDQPGEHLFDPTQTKASTRADEDADKIARLQATRAASFPGSEAGSKPADPKLEAAAAQLAERKWWAGYLEEGRAADLEWRREREAAGESAAQ